MTLFINKAKLTTSAKNNNAKLTTFKIQVDHLCKNKMPKTQKLKLTRGFKKTEVDHGFKKFSNMSNLVVDKCLNMSI